MAATASRKRKREEESPPAVATTTTTTATAATPTPEVTAAAAAIGRGTLFPAHLVDLSRRPRVYLAAGKGGEHHGRACVDFWPEWPPTVASFGSAADLTRWLVAAFGRARFDLWFPDGGIAEWAAPQQTTTTTTTTPGRRGRKEGHRQ